MKAFRNRQGIAKWREDENGLLTVTVCVLKEGVYPYGADECEGLPEALAGRDTVMEFIPASEFTPEAMKTLEGKPATIMTAEDDAHEWRTPDNAMKDGLTVGAVAGTPWVEGDELRCDLLLSDREAIEAVKQAVSSPLLETTIRRVRGRNHLWRRNVQRRGVSGPAIGFPVQPHPAPSRRRGAAGAGHTNHQQKDDEHG